MRRFYNGVLVEVLGQVGKMLRVYVLEGPSAGRVWVVDAKLLKKGQDLFAKRVDLE